MIGNFVEYNGRIIQVDSFNKNYIYYIIEGRKKQATLSLCSGIPLTAKILEDSKFSKEEVKEDRWGSDPYTFYFYEGVTIYDNNDTRGKFDFAVYVKSNGEFKSGWSILTVHQLQNLVTSITGHPFNAVIK